MDEPRISPVFNKTAQKQNEVCKNFAERGRKQMARSTRYLQTQIKPSDEANPFSECVIFEGPNGLKFNVEKYILQFEGCDMTREQKIQVLRALWDMMGRFVELGFGLDPVSQACEQATGISSEEFENLVKSDNPQNIEE